MATIVAIERASGIAYRATVRIKRNGQMLVNKSRTFDTEREALRWANDTEREAKREVKQNPVALKPVLRRSTMTLAEVLRGYIAEVEGIKPLGDTKRQVMTTLANSSLGELDLTALTGPALHAYAVDRVKVHGNSPSTVLTYVQYLRIAVEYAHAAWRIESDALKEIDGIKPLLRKLGLIGQGQERDRRLDPGEYERLRDHFTSYQQKPRVTLPMWDLVEFAIASAFRLGEILNLRWADLDEQKRLILIRDRKDPRRKIGNHQLVPLIPPAWAVIQRQPRTDERIFPYIETSVSCVWRLEVARAGIADLHFHDLRHEGTARLFEAGLAIEEVALITGHKNWNTLRRYLQLRPESLHDKWKGEP